MKNYFMLCGCSLLILFYSCSNHKSYSAADDLLNLPASLPASFAFGHKGFRILTSVFNNRDGTVAMLYGNEKAKRQALTGDRNAQGAQWALITWRSSPDKHWFGANIPGELLSVETISLDSALPGPPVANYARYSGKDLGKEKSQSDDADRIRFILSLPPAVMP